MGKTTFLKPVAPCREEMLLMFEKSDRASLILGYELR